MKILIIGNVEYRTDNAAALRVIEVAKLLFAQGHEVEVFDGMGDYSNKEQDAPIARYAQLHVAAPPQGLVRRFLVKLGRGFSLLHSDKVSGKSFELIYCYGSALSWTIAGWLFARHNRARLVADVTELYGFEDMFKSVSYFRSRIGTWIGIFIILPLTAHAIAVPSRYFLRIMRNFHRNLYLLPPFFDELLERRVKQKDDSNELILVYAGAPSTKEEFSPLFTSLLSLPIDMPRSIRLKLVGLNDTQVDKMLAVCGAQKLWRSPNVFIEAIGRVDVATARQIVADADFLIVLRQLSLRVNCGFPSKVAEAFIIGTPIITNNYSDIGIYVKNGCNGFLIEIVTTQSVCNILLHCVNLGKEDVLRMAQQSRSTGSASFSSKAVNQQIRQLIS